MSVLFVNRDRKYMEEHSTSQLTCLAARTLQSPQKVTKTSEYLCCFCCFLFVAVMHLSLSRSLAAHLAFQLNSISILI